jgi:DNA-binding SARP family transcriptional activator
MLGPLEVRTDGDPGKVVEVAGARLRALLIMLALHPGQLVTASQLIDGLWPAEMPAGAANALQALVSRLRRVLPEAVIESRPPGYQLSLDPWSTGEARSVLGDARYGQAYQRGREGGLGGLVPPLIPGA